MPDSMSQLGLSSLPQVAWSWLKQQPAEFMKGAQQAAQDARSLYHPGVAVSPLGQIAQSYAFGIGPKEVSEPFETSGEFRFIHGHQPENGPLPKFDASAAGKFRYDQGEGLFGPDGVYMAENGRWVSGDSASLGHLEPFEIGTKFNKALVITPGNEKKIAEVFGTNEPRKLADKARAAGYDGIIVRGIDDDPHAPRHLDVQDQVFAMKPEELRVNRKMDDRELPELNTPEMLEWRSKARAWAQQHYPDYYDWERQWKP